MRMHRAFAPALATLVLGIVPVARAQPAVTHGDDLPWDLVDEDCGVLPEGGAPEPRRVSDTTGTPVDTIAIPSRPPTPEPSRASAPMARATSPTPGPERSTPPVASHDGTLPRGRAVGGLAPQACEAVLRAEGVPFERASSGGASPAIAQPIRLGGPLRGVTIRAHGGDDSSIHSIIDCRLAVALLGWADELHAAGFVAIEHVSIFRPGARVAGTHRPSGHSHALALDALRFVREDGTFFSVLDDWSARVRGTDPCATYDEPAASASVRALVCSAVASETFQVVITPHHDDAHANHVHLEIVPGVDWTVAR